MSSLLFDALGITGTIDLIKPGSIVCLSTRSELTCQLRDNGMLFRDSIRWPTEQSNNVTDVVNCITDRIKNNNTLFVVHITQHSKLRCSEFETMKELVSAINSSRCCVAFVRDETANLPTWANIRSLTSIQCFA
ncbi:hypothetical protein F7U66_00140 [Vibrio parahaemolyticus]|nr:hypothetical protein [Vibrio parahaemolyticus]